MVFVVIAGGTIVVLRVLLTLKKIDAEKEGYAQRKKEVYANLLKEKDRRT